VLEPCLYAPARLKVKKRTGRSLVSRIVFPYSHIKANGQRLMEVSVRFFVLRAMVAATRLQSLSICSLLASCARRLAIENASTPEFDIRVFASRSIPSLSP
jgi:hypothetical protein